MFLEAYAGGNLAVVETGDMVRISMKEKSINVLVDDDVLQKRIEEWKGPPQKDREERMNGYLLKYRRLVKCPCWCNYQCNFLKVSAIINYITYTSSNTILRGFLFFIEEI